jgi:hypothetical protein
MSSRRRTIVAVAVLLFGLSGIADLRAAGERPAGFDCPKDKSPLAVTVCGDRAAAAAERRTTISYLALYFGLGEESRPGFRNDHMQWVNGLTAQCSPPSNPQQVDGDQPALPPECVRRLYTQRAELYRKKLGGLALEEANLSPALLKKIQKRLVELKFLSGTVDGMFGADTRAAIKNYQTSIGHAQTNFLSAPERNALLDLTEKPAQTSSSIPAPVGASESPSETALPQQSTFQNLQSSDSRPPEPDTAARLVAQTAEQSASGATNPPADPDVAAQTDGRTDPQTHYVLEGAILAVVILAFAIIFVFLKSRRRTKLATEDDGSAPPRVSLKVLDWPQPIAQSKQAATSILPRTRVDPRDAQNASLAPEGRVEFRGQLGTAGKR